MKGKINKILHLTPLFLLLIVSWILLGIGDFIFAIFVAIFALLWAELL